MKTTPIRPFSSCLILTATVLFAGISHGQTFSWQGANGGNWTNVANWNNTVPGAADIAILSDSGSAGQTLTLDADAAIAGLSFNNLVANQVIASPAGKILTLQSGNVVTVDAGSHSISANVDITSGTKLGPGTATWGCNSSSVNWFLAGQSRFFG